MNGLDSIAIEHWEDKSISWLKWANVDAGYCIYAGRQMVYGIKVMSLNVQLGVKEDHWVNTDQKNGIRTKLQSFCGGFSLPVEGRDNY